MGRGRSKALKVMLAIIPVLIAAALFVVARGQREPPAPVDIRAYPQEPAAPDPDAGSTESGPSTLGEAELARIAERTTERLDQEKRDKVAKAIKELNAKLYVEDPSDGGGSTDRRTRRRLRVSLEERVRLIEEFLKEFPLSDDNYQCGVGLASVYRQMKRYDDAERLYGEVVACFSDGYFTSKQETLQELAKMQMDIGNLDGSEKTLLEIINASPPALYNEIQDRSIRDREGRNKNITAPLLLAGLYGRTGRPEDAETLLAKVEEYALSLPREYELYDNIPSYTGEVCGKRIQLLFERTTVEGLDDAVKTADGYVHDYGRKLDGLAWTSPHAEEYILAQVDSLHAYALYKACSMRIDSLFEKVSPAGADDAMKASEALIDVYGKSLDTYQWNDPERARERYSGVRYMSPGSMREYAAKLAAKKKATEGSR